MLKRDLPADIQRIVRCALSEDLGSGDLSAALLREGAISSAIVISREPAVLCGAAWFDEVFRQLDENVAINWRYGDGDEIRCGQTVCSLSGQTKAILSGERTALNFIQTLSGTATTTRGYAELIKGASVQLLDTRKTIPGLRSAQKYAVLCGGGRNHRMGLYDAILLKDNHIKAAGSVTAAIGKARSLHRRIEIEVSDLNELQEAIVARADIILLDNFTLEQIRQAVAMNNGAVELEVSGNVDRQSISDIADTGVDFISLGLLTKNVKAIDFSLSIIEP